MNLLVSRDQLPYITIMWSTAVYHEKYTAPYYWVEYANSDRINLVLRIEYRSSRCKGAWEMFLFSLSLMNLPNKTDHGIDISLFWFRCSLGIDIDQILFSHCLIVFNVNNFIVKKTTKSLFNQDIKRQNKILIYHFSQNNSIWYKFM